MSIQSNSSKAVPALLKSLKKTFNNYKNVLPGKETDLQTINGRINQLMCQHERVKEWQEEVLELFSDLDRHHHKILDLDHHRNVEVANNLKCIRDKLTEIIKSLNQLHPKQQENTKQTDLNVGNSGSQDEEHYSPKLSSLGKIIVEDHDNPVVESLRVSYDFLGDEVHLKTCFLLLAIFPENAVLKKRLLIYWWTGEGLVQDEKEGEEIFVKLLEHELIIPCRTGACPTVNKCQVHPWIRYMLISIATNKEKILHLDDDGNGKIPCFDPNHNSRHACLIAGRKIGSSSFGTLRTVFNVNKSYLSWEDDWLSKLRRLRVLQLGRWQASPKHHIEVKASIAELTSLEILDLKACHNLETLPDEITSLMKLTHLDISECYLLESLPRGLAKLTSLQVLKGFTIGSEADLKENEFDRLQDLENLKCLKISWGTLNMNLKVVSFPPSLEKLDLKGFPNRKIPEWLQASKLTQLKNLYINGGNLCDKPVGKWNVEILIIKHTKLNIKEHEVCELFPSLKYVIFQCRKEEDEASTEYPD
ncbi:disease resistance RPP13-like protein 4 [Prosopis cineraria]|uniref:disease resistance RPP13-like protein 4 n=1 Tax=Prosopis cineraria TaxID=364024 RepID=UPI00240EB917|nr:disease resistance RPP13-like protein 4 [Prosopis cineraria]